MRGALILSFVDDTYIMVRSYSWELNCARIELIHNILFKWAKENGITFAPDKYTLLHFRSSDCQDTITLRPNIDGLPPDEKLFKYPFIDILGVRVDDRLSWEEHLKKIEDKITRQKSFMRCMSGSLWGPNLVEMRQLYLGQLQSIIGYACPIWFLSFKGSIKQGRILKPQADELDRLQGECLYITSGAFKNTSRALLRKELHIHRLSDYLAAKAIAHQAKVHNTPHAKGPRNERNRLLTPKQQERHPLHLLDKAAVQLKALAKKLVGESLGREEAENMWNDESRHAERSHAINNSTKVVLNALSSGAWAKYKKTRKPRTMLERPLALNEGWDKTSLNYYKGLTRRQSTILLHRRTGWIGLRSYLHWAELETSNLCPSCYAGSHTVEHLFIHCKMLREPQQELFNKVGNHDLRAIFQDHPRLAADFALQNFGIPQFDPLAAGSPMGGAIQGQKRPSPFVADTQGGTPLVKRQKTLSELSRWK
ncbi:reverse transcriptase [Paramyrothecium foliicola]|nr:reverse transcriptase [Paramyrothecium foliicola]